MFMEVWPHSKALAPRHPAEMAGADGSCGERHPHGSQEAARGPGQGWGWTVRYCISPAPVRTSEQGSCEVGQFS